jgi:replication factor C large subunit
MDWTEKYRPNSLDELRGNNKARDKLQEWARNWDDHNQAVILYGAPGVGKTSAAHALGNDMNWDVIELNASDQRTADVIDKVAGEAAKSGTLTGGSSGKKLVVLDEADNIHGNYDRGGSQAISRLVKEASQPMILIANDFYEMSNSLRNNCKDIEFGDVSARSIKPALRDICNEEGIEYDDDAIESLAKKNAGDLRSAVNDLQALAQTDKRLTADDVVTGDRDRKDGVFDFLDDLIKTGSPKEVRDAAMGVDETPDSLINWIDDNMPKDYSGAELSKAYEFLVNADKWLGRVRATQNYSYWRYANDNMTAGVAASRNGTKSGWTRYGPPSYWRKLGSSKGKRNKRDYIAQKIADVSGVSMSTARNEVMPFLGVMTHHCKNRELTVAMTAMYDLKPKHVSFITGSGEDTNKVQSIVEDAEELHEDRAVEAAGDAFAPGTDLDDATTDTDTEESDSSGSENTGLGDFTQDFEDDEDAESDSKSLDGDRDDEPAKEEKAEDDDSQRGLGDFMN